MLLALAAVGYLPSVPDFMSRLLKCTAGRACRSLVDAQRGCMQSDMTSCSVVDDAVQYTWQKLRDMSGSATHCTAAQQQQFLRTQPSGAVTATVAVRPFSSGTGELTEEQYHRIADETLHTLLDDIEVVIDDRGLDAADVEMGQGVMTLKLGEQGTYVVNKQAPNRQLWLSSPISGPVRYDHKGSEWVYQRDGHLMHDRLEAELSNLMGGPVQLTRPKSGSNS